MRSLPVCLFILFAVTSSACGDIYCELQGKTGWRYNRTILATAPLAAGQTFGPEHYVEDGTCTGFRHHMTIEPDDAAAYHGKVLTEAVEKGDAINRMHFGEENKVQF